MRINKIFIGVFLLICTFCVQSKMFSQLQKYNIEKQESSDLFQSFLIDNKDSLVSLGYYEEGCSKRFRKKFFTYALDYYKVKNKRDTIDYDLFFPITHGLCQCLNIDEAFYDSLFNLEPSVFADTKVVMFFFYGTLHPNFIKALPKENITSFKYTIPIEVSPCTWLWNKNSDIPEEFWALNKITELDLFVDTLSLKIQQFIYLNKLSLVYPKAVPNKEIWNKLINLQSIYIENLMFKELSQLSSIVGAINLREVVLKNGSIPIENTKSIENTLLEPFSTLSFLEVLKIKNIGYWQVENLHSSIELGTSTATFHSLDSLYFEGLPIDSVFFNVKCFKKLSYLTISENNIKYISFLWAKKSEIKYLDMSHNQLKELFKNICNFKKLETLNLSYNKIITLPKNLKRLKKLKRLDLTQNPIPASEIAALRKAMPWCEIIH